MIWSWQFPVKLHSSKCHRTSMIGQHWFKVCLGAINHEASIWSNDDYSLPLCQRYHDVNKPQVITNGFIHPLIAKFMGPTWGPSGADRTQVGPMLAPWTLLSGSLRVVTFYYLIMSLAWLNCLDRVDFLLNIILKYFEDWRILKYFEEWTTEFCMILILISLHADMFLRNLHL